MKPTSDPRSEASGKRESFLSRWLSRHSSQKKPKLSNSANSSSVKVEIPGQPTLKLTPYPPKQAPDTNGQGVDTQSNRGGDVPPHQQLEASAVIHSDLNEAIPSPPSEPGNGEESVRWSVSLANKGDAHSNASAAQSDEIEGGEDLETSASDPLRDLWAEAWNSEEVGEERRSLLRAEWEGEETNSQELVSGVIEHTQDKLATYEKRWGSDNEKTAAGIAKSILLSALMVKDLVDAGLKFDPTGYGSSAWAVVSFGLKVGG